MKILGQLVSSCDLMQDAFPNITPNYLKYQWLREILAPKHDPVQTMCKDPFLELFSQAAPVDSVTHIDESVHFPVEFKTRSPPCMQSHNIKLKEALYYSGICIRQFDTTAQDY